MAAEYIASAGNPRSSCASAASGRSRRRPATRSTSTAVPLDAPPDPPAGRRRPVARDRQALARQAAGDRRRGGGRRRDHGRGPPATPTRRCPTPSSSSTSTMFDVDDGRGHRRPRARQGPPRRPPATAAVRPGPDAGRCDRRERRRTGRRALVVRPAARLRGVARAARRQVDLPSRAAARAARRGRDRGSRPRATARTCGRRRRRRRARAPTVERRARGAAAGSTTASRAPAATRSPSPTAILDCGNSGTTTRLLAGRPRRSRPVRDPRRRRLAAPPADGARRRAAPRDGRRGRGPARRHAAAARDHRPRAADAHRLRDAGPQRPGQVGDPARRRSRRTARRAVTEAVATRDHTERMLRARGVAGGRARDRRRRATP